LNRRLGGPQRQSRHFGEKKIFFPSWDLNPSFASLWPCHYTHYAKTRNVYQIQLGNPKGRHHLAVLDMDGNIILKYSYVLLASSDLTIGCNFNPASVFHQSFLVIT
jgi:hypothetical protein